MVIIMKKNAQNTLPLEIERKLLIAMPDEAVLSAQKGRSCHHIRQTYLSCLTKGETRRIRCRRQENGSCVYTETKKRPLAALTCIEQEREISQEEYELLLKERDPAKKDIEKKRYTIPFYGHLIEIDIYPFWKKIAILEVELSAPNEVFALPPYITVLADVSNDRRFKNSALAKDIPNEALLF